VARINPEALKHTKILLVDIERLPGLAEAWDQKTRYVPYTKFHRLPETLCFTAKWYGRRRCEFQSSWRQGHESMVRRSWELYDQADIVVTYNGVKFDNEWLRADWQHYRLGDPRPWKDVDLFRENLKFGRLSYSLAHLAQLLGLDGKSGHYDSGVAEAAMQGRRWAQSELRTYNIRDVTLLEEVYDECRGQLPSHPHLKVPLAKGELSCNQCGYSDLEDAGEYIAQVLVYPQYRCTHCSGNIKDRKSIGRIAWSAGVR
jgi:hypothetical protein